MKQVYVDARPWNKELVITALESGTDGVVVDSAVPVRELGRIMTIAPDGDLILGKDIIELTIESSEDQEYAMAAAQRGKIIVHTPDWTVIPLENLVALADSVIAVVRNRQEAELAIQVLEKGVYGVLLKTSDPDEIRAVVNLVQESSFKKELVQLKIVDIRPLGMGERVCVDTSSIMGEGEGMLIGNTSSGFFLVHAETLDNPYVAPRPFRVNAGGVHSYIQVPEGRTAYLADLHAGSNVMVIRSDGSTRTAPVGRVKIERRPLLLVSAEYIDLKVSVILQNAETIRLIKPDGHAISVAKLQTGDLVLGAVSAAGRHFGIAVNELIIEK